MGNNETTRRPVHQRRSTGKPALDPYRSPGTPKVARDGGAMFGNFKDAKNRKMPKWAGPLLLSAAIFHVALFIGMWRSRSGRSSSSSARRRRSTSRSHRRLRLLLRRRRWREAQTQVITPKKIKVKDIVQPVKIEKQQQVVEETGSTGGVEGGVEGGQEGGVLGGDLNGVMGAPPPPPPPPPPAPPQNIRPRCSKARASRVTRTSCPTTSRRRDPTLGQGQDRR